MRRTGPQNANLKRIKTSKRPIGVNPVVFYCLRTEKAKIHVNTRGISSALSILIRRFVRSPRQKPTETTIERSIAMKKLALLAAIIMVIIMPATTIAENVPENDLVIREESWSEKDSSIEDTKEPECAEGKAPENAPDSADRNTGRPRKSRPRPGQSP